MIKFVPELTIGTALEEIGFLSRAAALRWFELDYKLLIGAVGREVQGWLMVVEAPHGEVLLQHFRVEAFFKSLKVLTQNRSIIA